MLQKQAININFAQGLDTKTDPKQVQLGKMLALQNSIFDKAGLLQKRNGFGPLVTLPDDTSVSLGTFNGNLIAVGTDLRALSQDSAQWIECGKIQPIELDVLPVVRTSTSQTTADVTVASNGLACAVYLDANGNSYYQIIDSKTGQIIVPVAQLPATATMPRVFSLGLRFIITFLITISGTTHLQYIDIPINNPLAPSGQVNVSSQVSSLTAGYDGVVANSNLYLAWDGSDIGGAIRYTYIDSHLNAHLTKTFAGHSSTFMSVTADTASTGVIWFTFWDSGSTNGFSAATDYNLGVILAPTQTITTTDLQALTSSANAGIAKIFGEVINDYTYESVRTDFIASITVTQSGTVGSPVIILRGVGIQSKAFYFPSTAKSYLLASYGQAFQPTYFLIDEFGDIIGKLAYSNGSGYPINEIIPSVTVTGSLVQVGYLFKDLLVPVNKAQGVTNVAGIYSQNGINLASFTISDSVMVTSEIAGNLHLAGGFLWMYDGVKPVEHGFHVWPEDIVATTDPTGGNLSDQQYFYAFTYEWTDAQGNIHRSAPSVPVSIVTSGGGTSTNTINVPTLRLTYKLAPNSVRIVGYRWSVAQQVYYQFTSIPAPIINDPSVDSIAITDTLADASILGNLIIYTAGNVVENIGAPACSTLALYKSRMVLVTAEDKNLIWYSKQVIENVPVEFSNLFTIYTAPTTGAQGSTGPTRVLSAMDDKLLFFKEDAGYYITGNGPDNTGANNDFSDPTFITSTVGTSNQQSLVMTPSGILFQSDKGIWILGRDLSTSYIGAPVELYNSALVESAINIPGTNQVRFTLDNGVTLMYDYYFQQWGTFNNIPAISSTLYQGLHTYLNKLGQVFQETPDQYLDNSNPVLLSFTTSWLNLAGLQGYQRAFFFYLLGEYFSPHKLQCLIAYDYNPAPIQGTLIMPTNFAPTYGGPESNGQNTVYGNGTPYGGPSAVEDWRVFLDKQRCTAFQITVQEVYDASLGVTAGAGLTLSGINLVHAIKKGYRPISAAHSAGGGSV